VATKRNGYYLQFGQVDEDTKRLGTTGSVFRAKDSPKFWGFNLHYLYCKQPNFETTQTNKFNLPIFSPD